MIRGIPQLFLNLTCIATTVDEAIPLEAAFGQGPLRTVEKPVDTNKRDAVATGFYTNTNFVISSMNVKDVQPTQGQETTSSSNTSAYRLQTLQGQ